MKPAKILILNLNPSDCLGDELRSIVESQFEVEEVKIWEKIGPDPAITDCDKKLAQLFSRSDFYFFDFKLRFDDRAKLVTQTIRGIEVEDQDLGRFHSSSPL